MHARKWPLPLCCTLWLQQSWIWCVFLEPVCVSLEVQYRVWILGRNPDKSLVSFPPCFSVTSTALLWDLYFFKLAQPLKVSVNGQRGKLDRKPYPPCLSFKKSVQKPQVWELSILCPENSMKLYVNEFGISTLFILCKPQSNSRPL